MVRFAGSTYQMSWIDRGLLGPHLGSMTRLPYPRPNIIPKDDAWRSVTLERVAASGETTLWLECSLCQHHVYEPIDAFRARTGLPGDTPFLAVSLALKCTRCGEQWAMCRTKPYGVDDKTKADREREAR